MSRNLIVEGNTSNRAPLLAVPKPEDFGSLAAENGLPGVEAAQREQSDLILRDVTLGAPFLCP